MTLLDAVSGAGRGFTRVLHCGDMVALLTSLVSAPFSVLSARVEEHGRSCVSSWLQGHLQLTTASTNAPLQQCFHLLQVFGGDQADVVRGATEQLFVRAVADKDNLAHAIERSLQHALSTYERAGLATARPVLVSAMAEQCAVLLRQRLASHVRLSAHSMAAFNDTKRLVEVFGKLDETTVAVFPKLASIATIRMLEFVSEQDQLGLECLHRCLAEQRAFRPISDSVRYSQSVVDFMLVLSQQVQGFASLCRLLHPHGLDMLANFTELLERHVRSYAESHQHACETAVGKAQKHHTSRPRAHKSFLSRIAHRLSPLLSSAIATSSATRSDSPDGGSTLTRASTLVTMSHDARESFSLNHPALRCACVALANLSEIRGRLDALGVELADELSSLSSARPTSLSPTKRLVEQCIHAGAACVASFFVEDLVLPLLKGRLYVPSFSDKTLDDSGVLDVLASLTSVLFEELPDSAACAALHCMLTSFAKALQRTVLSSTSGIRTDGLDESELCVLRDDIQTLTQLFSTELPREDVAEAVEPLSLLLSLLSLPDDALVAVHTDAHQEQHQVTVRNLLRKRAHERSERGTDAQGDALGTRSRLSLSIPMSRRRRSSQLSLSSQAADLLQRYGSQMEK